MLDKYNVFETLGSGLTYKMKLGLDQESGYRVALKIFTDSLDFLRKSVVNWFRNINIA